MDRNIIISESKNKRLIRQIDCDKTINKINIFANVAFPFGIDTAYGKRYAKLKIFDNFDLFINIDEKILNLCPDFSSVFYGNLVQTIIHKNIKVYNSEGKELSSFAIEKGSRGCAWLELEELFDKSKTYKWYISKVILE